MKIHRKRNLWMAVVLLAGLAASLAAEELSPVELPKPQTDGGKPLMQAIGLRATSRTFAPDPLPVQTLSNLLWAAWGINRPETKKRTAPSAMNWQETDIYVVMEKGTYVYDATAHVLKPAVAGDFRALTGKQDFVKEAPMTLVLVADLTRMGDAPVEMKTPTAWCDAAFIGQNVHLFCASEGLATGVRGNIDKPVLAAALKLGANQFVSFAMTVGFPKK